MGDGGSPQTPAQSPGPTPREGSLPLTHSGARRTCRTGGTLVSRRTLCRRKRPRSEVSTDRPQAGTCICSPTPSPMAVPCAPPSDSEEVQAWTFLRIIPSHVSSLGSSSGPCGAGGPGEPSTDSSTHRGAGQTLQTGEATVSLQSPLASLSSFSFVTSGALRALGTRHTDTGWVSSAHSKSPLLASPETRSPRSLWAPLPTEPAHQDPAQGTQILTGIPRAPAGPAGPMGPCAPCGGSGGGQCQRAVEAGMAHCCVPMAQRPMGWAPRQLLHNPDPGLFPGPGAGEGGRWRGAPCPPGHPPAP